MEQKITYIKNEKLEELDDKIAEILSDAIYSYIVRKCLFKKVNRLLLNENKNIDNGMQI